MNKFDTSTLEAGQRVGLVNADFAKVAAEFEPVQDAAAEINSLTEALAQKQHDQSIDTKADTSGKEQARENMAVAADILSKRAVPYALVQKDTQLKQRLTLTYTDVRHGEETEDMNHVVDLIANVEALPDAARKRFRLTPELLQATRDTVSAFSTAGSDQVIAKAAGRLATRSVPELLTALRGQLVLLGTLLAGVASEGSQWADFHAAFLDANKRRAVAPKHHLKPTTRVVRRFSLHRATDQAGPALDQRPYPADHTFEMENLSNSPLLLWLAQADGLPVAPAPTVCPAGVVTTVPRAALGPDTATYLLARFEGKSGGDAKIVVRRVVVVEA